MPSSYRLAERVSIMAASRLVRTSAIRQISNRLRHNNGRWTSDGVGAISAHDSYTVLGEFL